MHWWGLHHWQTTSLHYAIHHPHIFVLCPHTLSFALTPCPLPSHPVLCPHTLSFALTPSPFPSHPVLCPHTLSFSLIPLSFTLERPMSAAPHHPSQPFDCHCGHPTRVPRGWGASWNTQRGGREERVGNVQRRGRCMWWHGWGGGWTTCERGDGGQHGMDGQEGNM